MTCLYNIDNTTKALLKHYEDVLGSYEAAYYVLSLNNGYGLDLTPYGLPSQLYENLKQKYGEDEAIRRKSVVYTDTCYKQIGNWTNGESDPVFLDQNDEPKFAYVDGNTDPRLIDVLNNLFLRDDIGDTLNTLDYQTDPTNPDLENVALQRILNTSYDTYVNEELKKNPDKSELGVRKARKTASHEWYKRKVKQIIQEQLLVLAKAFGLEFVTNSDGSIELRGSEDEWNGKKVTTKMLRIKFVQNLNYDPLEDERRGIFGDLLLDQKFKETDSNHDMYVSDAVVEANHEDMFVAKNGLIYISLNNGTALTFNKVLTYHYIMTYFDSPLIQSAIDSILPDNENLSTMYKVRKLVDYLTGVGTKDANGTSILDKFYANNKELTQDQTQQVEFFNNFWNEFDELNDQIINKGLKSDSARKKILSTLAAAIIVDEKMPRSSWDETVPQDFYFRYMPSSLEKLRQELNDFYVLLNTLLQSYENRKKRSDKLPTDLVNLHALSRMLIALEDIKNYQYNNIGDIRKAVENFLENGILEIYDAAQELEKINVNYYDIKSDNALHASKTISIIHSDVIGFYKALLKEINSLLNNNPEIKTSSIDKRQKLMNLDIIALEINYQKILKTLSFKIVDIYVDKYWGNDIVSPAEKQNLKNNCHLYLTNQALNGDIASYETLITMNSYSRSSICRLVFDAIQHLNKKREEATREKAVQLALLLDKTKKQLILQGRVDTAILGNNFLRIFLEIDESGKPTGYFTRPLNYGKFYKQRSIAVARFQTEIQDLIRKDLGDPLFTLEKDSHGNLIFPEDEFFDKYYKDYALRLNHFDCTHANKQYTEEYYEIRIKTLSRKTIKAQNDIQNKIDIILTPVMLEGTPHPERLSEADLVELMMLLLQQETLSSRYDIFGHLKQGDDLLIANELRDFKEKVKGGREYATNEERYNNAIKDLTPELKKMFESFMSGWQIQPSFWDAYNKLKEEYRSQFPPSFDGIFERLDDINQEKMEIMNYAKTIHYHIANIENLSDDAFLRIKELDIELLGLLLNIYEYLKTLGDNLILSAFKQLGGIGSYMTTNEKGEPITKFQKMIQRAIQEDKEESQRTGMPVDENLAKALSLYTIEYVRSDGSIGRHPTSAFTYFKPADVISDEVLLRTGLDPTKLVLQTPNKIFNEVVGGEYMNPFFDKNNPERVQPKEKNPQFDKIKSNPALYELYIQLLETIAESNSLIPNTRNNSNYRLPQIGASSMTVWSRNHAYNPIPAVQYSFDRTFNVNETDTEINDDFYTLPDGTRINNVPLRYIQMLDNPETITADVVGSVIAYYDMAVNFDLKSKAAPVIESLLQQVGMDSKVHGVSFSGKQTSLYSKLNNIIQSRLYENEAVWGTNRTEKLSSGKKRGFKAMKFISKFGTLAALSRNFISYGTGFIDAVGRLWSMAIAGDAINIKNFFKGVSTLLWYLADGLIVLNIGQYLPNNRMSVLMHKAKLSTGTIDHFSNTHKSRVRRAFAEIKTGMAGFRVSDYLINGILTTAYCDNIRYYERDDVGTFLSEWEWINRYLKDNDGSTLNEARNAYNKSDSLFDAYDLNRSKLHIYGKIENATLKDKYKVSKKELATIENKLSIALNTQAAKVNGAVPNADKAAMYQNPLIKPVSNLRNYLVNDFQTRWATGDDFLDADTSIRNINMLKSKRTALKKALKEKYRLMKASGGNEYTKAVDEINKKIDELKSKANNANPSNIVFNAELWKDAAKSFFMGAAAGTSISATSKIGIAALISISPNIIVASGAILGGISAATISIYNNVVNSNYIRINEKLSIIDQILVLEKMRDTLMSGESEDIIIEQINALDKKIQELTNLNKMRKGFANFSLRQKCLGYNRALGSALTTLINKIKYFYKTNFVNSWKDLSEDDIRKYKPKFSRLEKIGIRKCLGDMSNIMFWMILASILYGFKQDDPELVVPAKVADWALDNTFGTNKPVEKGLGDLYKWGDQRLESILNTVVGNDFVQNGAQSIYDVVRNNNVIPLDNDVIERMMEARLELLLGKKASVKTKTGLVKYKNVTNNLLLRDLLKSYFALQSLRAFSEFEQPYDFTAINDMLSTTSATNNINFKMIELDVQLFNDVANGNSEKLVQRGPYTTFTKTQYHEARGPLRFTGIPTLFEETSQAGLDSRFEYTRSLGFNSIFFPKKELTGKKKSSKK